MLSKNHIIPAGAWTSGAVVPAMGPKAGTDLRDQIYDLCHGVLLSLEKTDPLCYIKIILLWTWI